MTPGPAGRRPLRDLLDEVGDGLAGYSNDEGKFLSLAYLVTTLPAFTYQSVSQTPAYRTCPWSPAMQR